jgi:hypothetical protein
MQVPVFGWLLIILIRCSPAFQVSNVLVLQLHHLQVLRHLILQGGDNALQTTPPALFHAMKLLTLSPCFMLPERI